MRHRVIITLIILSFALTVPVWAVESGCTGTLPPGGKVSSGGQTAYVDPVSGELLSEPPPNDQLTAPAQIKQSSKSGEIQQQSRPDGSVVADIGDRFITELRVEIVDGKAVTCHRAGTEPRSLNTETGDQLKKLPDDGR